MSNESEPLALTNREDDLDVIKRVMAGEVDNFEVLLRKYSPRVFAMVGHKVPMEEVEPVAQEIFLSAFRSLGTYEALQPFEHWLARIVRRRCCDFWRERERHQKVESISMDGPDQPWLDYALAGLAHESSHQKDVTEESAERIRQALAKMDAEDRALIEGIYFEEATMKEMAATLDWSLVKTKVRAHRARKKLRVILEKLFKNEDGK
jgi:RNA polymerase sigma-70 factor (ECF subfamily)